MTKEQIETRIKELEEQKAVLDAKVSADRITVATRQQELKELQAKITEATWENTKEFKELEDLKTALEVINRF